MNEIATVVVIVAGLIYITERFAEYASLREAGAIMQAKRLILKGLDKARSDIEVDFELWWDETGRKATERAIRLTFMEEDARQLPPDDLLEGVIYHNALQMKSSIFTLATHNYYAELLEKKTRAVVSGKPSRSFRAQWQEACESATLLQAEIERLGIPLYEPAWK